MTEAVTKNKGPTCVLALDLASETGWAVWQPGHELVSGVWNTGLTRNESQGFRPIKLRARLNELKGAYPELDLVTWEEVRFCSHPQAHAVHNQLLSMLLVWCEDNGLEYSPTPVGTIKKHATGKGNAGKDAMMAAAAKRWPLYECVNDNEADARWVLDTLLARINVQQEPGKGGCAMSDAMPVKARTGYFVNQKQEPQ